MNKQELIKEFREIGIDSLNIFGTEVKSIPTESAITLIEQLDEPQPVKIPQCVANWIEYCKVKKITLAHALYRSEEAKNKSVYRWIFEDLDNQETFALAWIFGYEVEKEKRYLVKIKGEIKENKLVYGRGIERYFFAKGYDSSKRGKHTRKELEAAGFGWVFDCPGIEIEEVEE